MSDCRDPAFKLFGKTIALHLASDEGGGDEKQGSPSKEITIERKDKEREESPQSEEKGGPVTSTADQAQKPNSCSDDDDDDDQESASEKDPRGEERQSDSAGNNAQQEKPTLKKPDKILPCPRCNSMDTKFCYYNNYNVNQPRHFCKNCQRYWTAGGTMRNVPVGSGRRKNKDSASNHHYRQFTMTDAAALHPALKPNGTVLSFGSDSPFSESMAYVLNLAENTMKNCSRNNFHHGIDEQMEAQSSGSSATASNSTDEGTGTINLQDLAIRNCQGFTPHLPYINGSAWPYPWSPPPPPPPPGAAPFRGSSLPIPRYPATAYWGCSTWSIPWLTPPLSSPPLANGSSGPSSPTLGKHSREGDVLQRSSNHSSSSDRGESTVKQSNQDKYCLRIRIDDPDEAAKSSIWATMGLKNDKANGISSRGGIFKSFQTKAELNNHKVETSQLLHANPAAFSRSLSFQESS